MIRRVVLSTLLASQVIVVQAAQDLKYNINISGDYPKLYDEILDSDLLTDKKKVAPNMYALKSRVDKFMNLIEQTFCQHGYFDVVVQKDIQIKSENCIDVSITINQGEVYKISAVDIKFEDPQHLISEQDVLDQLRNKKFMNQSVHEIASYRLVEGIAERTQYYFLKRGFPFAVITNKALDIDRKTHTAAVKIDLKIGEKVLFGATTINGLQDVKEDYIRNRIYWVPNTPYNVRMVEDTVYAITNSQIFSKAEVYVDKEHIKDHVAPMIIDLVEDKKRAVEVSLFYSTVKSYNFQKLNSQNKKLRSFYASVSWSHYNLFHRGEILKLRAFGSPFSLNNCRSSHDYELSAEFIKQDILVPKDSGKFTAAFTRNNQNAYYMLGKSISAYWTSPFILPDLRVRVGTAIENNAVNGPDEIYQKYDAYSFPISVTYDKRDSILNPTKGYKLALNIDPIFTSNGRNISKVNIYASHVLRLANKRDAVIAYWVSGSKILYNDLKDIPLDKRLYAGGISSVRGYGNQMAGPLHKTKKKADKGENANANNNDNEAEMVDSKYPKGGKSSLEIGVELRKHIYKEISGVAFVESAAVGGLDKWYTGVGVGLRYQTVLGPIRFDIAFPVKRRHNIDNRFHFYLSFGQAF